MKVVAFNGSPRKGGNTEICLNVIGEELKKSDIAAVKRVFEYHGDGHRDV